MTFTSIRKSRGFTLVELLVVISIISLLASIINSNLSVARAKGVDAKKRVDLSEARTALSSFHADNETMPHNYDCTGTTCVINDSRSTLAIEDTANPTSPQTESGKAYQASMLELVNGKYLSGIPHSAGGAGYVYYNYGPNSEAGAVVGTTLDTVNPTTTGEPGSCRPFGTPTGQQGNGILGLDPKDPNNGSCIIVENGLSVEYSLNDPHCAGVPGYTGGGNGTGSGPTQGPNLCSPTSSKDYCLCVKY